MNRPPKEGLVWAAALAAALPAFLLPLHNPDLFWHLSAGGWIRAHGRLPYAEFLSFSAPGKAWLDFEWLPQLLYYAVYIANGLAGLWLLKIVTLAGCWLLLDAALRENALSARVRAAALVVWSVNALAWSDIRPELFSVLLFSLCLWRLEAVRLGRAEPGLGFAAGAALAFAAWSNLHGGFPLGLTLIAVYAAGELVEGRPRRAAGLAGACAAAALGALANPYGAGPYRVALEHFAARADLARYIAEWHPMSTESPLHWPFFATLAAVLAAAAARLAEPYEGRAPWTRRVPWAPLLLCGHLASNALLHARMAGYFGVAATLTLAIVAEEARGGLRRLLAGGLAVAVAFTAWLSPRLWWRGVFNDKDVPRPAAEFMARQEPVLAPLRLFNQWEWGGYLAWRLRPWYRVYSDGRYIFHDQLPRIAKAAESPDAWQSFLASERLNGALVPNRDAYLPSERRYPDGSTQRFDRPWYVAYFPRERWALVYWDAQSLLFVDRGAVPARWLAGHEYRWLRPKDAAAFEDARGRGEIPGPALDAERRRHEDEARAQR